MSETDTVPGDPVEAASDNVSTAEQHLEAESASGIAGDEAIPPGDAGDGHRSPHPEPVPGPPLADAPCLSPASVPELVPGSLASGGEHCPPAEHVVDESPASGGEHRPPAEDDVDEDGGAADGRRVRPRRRIPGQDQAHANVSQHLSPQELRCFRFVL